ncbi:hypothetical protein J7I93_15600 [Bacillus sp. ISL-47]|uniref:hypothetical protein n=1 Tax=Bacillus sp. ISL-47 TaxID=2819130 RepID=UPI001BED0A81|nr:hypothetical protein [Bacillus sp. ISL-47]MBT2689616.1 hypothetical protein [Bacillus sp. ISL-47]MBT2708435.1 hypothetical protein [Pseudomonas sp. ISL-84]
MTSYRLFNILGVILFTGIALQMFIQTSGAKKLMEAGGFVAVSALLYFILVSVFHKNKNLFVPLIAVLVLLSVGMIFLQEMIFGGAH